MPVEERAAPGVLSGEADAETVLEERSVGEGLRGAPVERLPALDHAAAVRHELRDARVEAEVRRNCSDALTDRTQPCEVDARRHALGPVHLAVGAPVDRE